MVWEVDMQVPKNLHILGPVGPRKFWVFWLPIHRCQRASEYLNKTASVPAFGSTFEIFRLRRAVNLHIIICVIEYKRCKHDRQRDIKPQRKPL